MANFDKLFASAARRSEFQIIADNIAQVERDANALRLPVSTDLSRGGVGTPLNANNYYLKGLPRLLTIIDRAGTGSNAASVANKAADLLCELGKMERVVPDGFARRGVPRPSFSEVKGQYSHFFDSFAVLPNYAEAVGWYVKVLRKYRPRYVQLSDQIKIPWYFIGIVHALEASFNFRAHLHNGDPLTARTTDVPSNRPPEWLPPSDWESSARDALGYDGFVGKSDWSVEMMLYRFEAYNGFGSRMHHVNSPYLWSFSNLYVSGKYVRVGNWSPTAVSQQCGAALMVKGLMQAQEINPRRE